MKKIDPLLSQIYLLTIFNNNYPPGYAIDLTTQVALPTTLPHKIIYSLYLLHPRFLSQPRRYRRPSLPLIPIPNRPQPFQHRLPPLQLQIHHSSPRLKIHLHQIRTQKIRHCYQFVRHHPSHLPPHLKPNQSQITLVGGYCTLHNSTFHQHGRYLSRCSLSEGIVKSCPFGVSSDVLPIFG